MQENNENAIAGCDRRGIFRQGKEKNSNTAHEMLRILNANLKYTSPVLLSLLMKKQHKKQQFHLGKVWKMAAKGV